MKLVPPSLPRSSDVSSSFWFINKILININIMYTQWAGIATGYGMDGPGIDSRWGRDFPHLSRPVMGSTQPPVRWAPGLFRGIKLLLSRLIPYAEEIMGDHQCGFRRNRSTTDHIFCIRQILEKKWEHNEAVHQFFIDFKKAYDSVRRKAL